MCTEYMSTVKHTHTPDRESNGESFRAASVSEDLRLAYAVQGICKVTQLNVPIIFGPCS